MTQGTSFWDFSLAYYGGPGVMDCLLRLQDRDGADVNLLLLGLWAARRRQALSANDFARFDQAIAPWRQSVIAPLRAVRRAMKEPLGGIRDAPLREKVKAIELAAEEVVQRRLQQLLQAPDAAAIPDIAAMAQSNLNAYAGFLGINLATADRKVLVDALNGVREHE